MEEHELLDVLKSLVEFHSKGNPPPNMYQEPYRSDIFKLFRTAHDREWFEPEAQIRMTGDAIKDYFHQNFWPADKDETPEYKARIKTLNSILHNWEEWHYALQQYGQ